MFDHIGKKIKTLAIVIFVIGIIFSVFIGMFIGEVYAEVNAALAFFLFLVVVAIGITVSWLSVLLFYGFGELVDQSMDMTKRQEETHAALEEILLLLKEGQGTSPRQNTPPRQNPPSRQETYTPGTKSYAPSSAPYARKVTDMPDPEGKLPFCDAEEKKHEPSPEKETDFDQLYIPKT